ncbi:hypothetical protein [Aquisalimonas asiatica]|uniref:Uncharacterized protein n=1 Tax=Aquisalimonas asiatica TaxID=406100 RepID=A0A1H8QTY8_9GAMM|nr:hypothetical protein [Aquisalimonas asiatica]SEO57719.1 hypothetical protein SAMN04488052_101791 [Aquisalimonas asiatica]
MIKLRVVGLLVGLWLIPLNLVGQPVPETDANLVIDCRHWIDDHERHAEVLDDAALKDWFLDEVNQACRSEGQVAYTDPVPRRDACRLFEIDATNALSLENRPLGDWCRY